MPDPYHHGNLREALLEAAVEAIRESGPTSWSLRDLARRAGVSHAAPTHHFGDKRGLLTALGTEGFGRLARELERAWADSGSFLEVGVAYVRFALANRPYFEVMYRPELLHVADPALAEARAAAARLLYGPLEAVSAADPTFDRNDAAIAAWSLVHGLATLWLSGNLPALAGDEPEAAARRIAGYLFHPIPAGSGFDTLPGPR
jgi:AcrR family transcriptional regulator